MIADSFGSVLPTLGMIAIVILVIFIFYIILNKAIVTAAGSAIKRKDDRDLVLRIWHYGYVFIALLVLVLSFSGSLAAAGISIGLFTAALGLALQKPITGVLAWLIILMKRPFKAGDIIIINKIKGEVDSITMFHIVLNELAGPAVGAESSNRTILVPTAMFFEKSIINCTLRSAYALDEVVAEFSSNSDLAKIEEIMQEAAGKFTADAVKARREKPFTRVAFSGKGVQVKVLYYAPAKDRQKVSSDITREIFAMVKSGKGIEFAVP